ncbi:MAG TPA: short-chain fatty acyl-CoA regulator family protein [Candidatus Polarisedimenticolaceae bacterium]|nr:short-chain fatty acyl-CoA regulator family protein [Candidatus Polarisedimenticolaceae bacterium]
MSEPIRLGAQIRSLRRQHGLTQSKMAERLAISASYLNLIEHGRRPLSAQLLIKLAQTFSIDLKAFGGEDQDRILADLMEACGDPLFDPYALTPDDLRNFAAHAPSAARAMIGLYRAFQGAKESARSLAERVSDGANMRDGIDTFHLPSEEVSDLVQRHANYFPELEDGAERIRQDAGLDGEDLYQGMARYLSEAHGVTVRVERVGKMRRAVRRFDPASRELLLSEVLRRGSRNFQLAYQLSMLTQRPVIDRLANDPNLTTADSIALARVTLANYCAAAVLMPYDPFQRAAKAERYDIELLGHRFRTSFEQVCHRLTTLRRPNAEGVPFHLVRVDAAGNISKRFSVSGIRIARFSGACPRWILHNAFLTPGMFRRQVSRMPDGTIFFAFSRTLAKEGAGFHGAHAAHAIEMGCPIEFARELVYSDGVDLDNVAAAVPVGVTCRLCERMDCEQRVFPALQTPLHVDENVRGVSFYAPVQD